MFKCSKLNNSEQHRILNSQLNIRINRGNVMPAFKEPVGTLNSTATQHFGRENNSKKEEPSRVSFHPDKHLHGQNGDSKIQQAIINSNKSINSTKFYDEQCRVCLEKGSIPIFGENKKIADIIMTIGCVEIMEFDPYPKYLCLDCNKRLLSGMLFRVTALKTDKLLRQTIGSEQESCMVNDAESHVSDMSDDEDFNEIFTQHLLSHTELIDCKSKMLTEESRNVTDSTEINTNMVQNDCVNNDERSNFKENINHSSEDMLKLPIKKIKVKFLNPVCDLNKNNSNGIQELNPNVSHKPLNNKLDIGKIIQMHYGDRYTVKGISKDCMNKILTGNNIYQEIPQIKPKIKVICPVPTQKCAPSVSENSTIIKHAMTENVSCNSAEIQDRSGPNSEVIEKDSLSCISGKKKPSEDDDYFGDNIKISHNLSCISGKKKPSEDDDYFGDNIKISPKPLKKIQTPSLTCEDCGLQFNYYKDYVTHTQENHPARKKAQCRFCKKMYSITYIERHVSYHENGSLMCEICGKQFFDVKNFTSHIEIHTYDLPFKCSLCPYRGRTTALVKQHIFRVHEKVKPHKCPECPKQFCNTGNLKMHINQHRGVHPFKCETCNIGFTSNGCLKRHKKTVHLGIRNNITECRLCGKNFTTSKRRMDHEWHEHKLKKISNRLPLHLKFEFMKRKKDLS